MVQHASAARAGVAALALGAFGGVAHAQYVVGAPIIIPTNQTIITLEFVSFEAAYTGELSFLGAGTLDAVTDSVADTGLIGLGQQTFVNKDATSGESVTLEGEYQAGDVLHFAYRVFAPPEASDVLRTDDVSTSTHFAWDEAAGLLHVEDLRPDHPWYDADYNDIIVKVNFTTVPGVGGLVTMMAAGFIGGPSRRRRSN